MVHLYYICSGICMSHSSYPVLVLFPSNLSSPDHLNNIYSGEALPVAVFALHHYVMIVNLHNGPFLPCHDKIPPTGGFFCMDPHDLPRSADHVVCNFYLKICHVVSPLSILYKTQLPIVILSYPYIWHSFSQAKLW